MKSFEQEFGEAQARIMALEAELKSSERIALALEAISEQLVTLNARLDAALGPGNSGRNSVTILDQLCALSDDTQTLVGAVREIR
jgi:hypothetical protein